MDGWGDGFLRSSPAIPFPLILNLLKDGNGGGETHEGPEGRRAILQQVQDERIEIPALFYRPSRASGNQRCRDAMKGAVNGTLSSASCHRELWGLTP